MNTKPLDWGPLPEATGFLPSRRGTFIDLEIIGGLSVGGATVVGDIYSSNWDGTIPPDLSGGADSGAAAGYALDASVGAAQFQTLYAEGGTLVDLNVAGTLTMTTGGEIRTGSSTPYLRILNASTLFIIADQNATSDGDLHWISGPYATVLQPSVDAGQVRPQLYLQASSSVPSYAYAALVGETGTYWMAGGGGTDRYDLRGYSNTIPVFLYDYSAGQLKQQYTTTYLVYDYGASQNLIYYDGTDLAVGSTSSSPVRAFGILTNSVGQSWIPYTDGAIYLSYLEEAVFNVREWNGTSHTYRVKIFGNNSGGSAGDIGLYDGGGTLEYWYDQSLSKHSLYCGGSIVFSLRTAGSGEGIRAPAIYNNTSASAANVVVDSNGEMYRSTSRGEWKQDVRPWAGSGVLDLTPVTFYPMKGDPNADIEAGEVGLRRHGTRKLLGLLYEDVQQRFPKGISSWDGIDWNAITTALLLEVKQLRQEVNALKGQRKAA